MENKNVIYNDDVERIVNDPERQRKIKENQRERKVKKQVSMLTDAVMLFVICICFTALGWMGLISNIVAYVLRVVTGLSSAFLFGRWFENGKCNGWQ